MAKRASKVPERAEYRRQWATLDIKDRRRIIRAVNRGRALDDRREAALAVQTARGQKRFWSKAWLLGPVASLFVLGEGWIAYAVNAAVLTALMGAMALFWYRRADRAERVNLERVERKGKRAKGRGARPGASDHTPRRRRP